MTITFITPENFTSMKESAKDINALMKTTGEIIKECKNVKYLNNKLLTDANKQNILMHVADVALRKELGFGDEKDLTLNDLVFIAISVELRNIRLRDKQRRDERVPLLKEIPASGHEITDEEEHEITGIAERAVNYFLEYSQEVKLVYQIDNQKNPDMIRELLEHDLIGTEDIKDVMARFKTTWGAIKSRVEAYRVADRKHLAIFNANSNVNDSLRFGDKAYGLS